MLAENRTRIVQFLTWLAVGGTEGQVLNLAREMAPEDFDLHIASLGRFPHVAEDLDEHGIRVWLYSVNSLYNARSLTARAAFVRDLRRNRIEIVHTYNFYANVFALPAARLAGVPAVIAAIRDTGELLTPLQKRVQRVFCRLADCVVANAEGVRQWLIAEGYDSEKIHVIRNGIPRARFARPIRGASLRRDLGLEPRIRVVAVVARLVAVKGIEYFLRAAASLAPRFPDARFVIVGDGPQRAELEALAARSEAAGCVVFAGLRHDVHEWLHEVDISVLPSLSEGLSNTLLESMAAGRPVVATRVGGTPEAVEDGTTGLLVPPRDAASLARAIALLLENPYLACSFGCAGRERAQRLFAMDRMVRETQSLYHRLLERSRVPRERRAPVPLSGSQ